MISVLSDKFLRDLNEDASCAKRMGNYAVLAVTDGLGGHAALSAGSGEIKTAVDKALGDRESVIKSDFYEVILRGIPMQ